MTQHLPVPIIGTGRHGSGYIAALLNEVGVVCGHEEFYNPLGERREALEVDSSWCALAFNLTEVPVLWQVRDPIDVVSSYLKAPLWGPYRPMAEVILGDLLPADPLDCAIAVTTGFIDACEVSKPERTWRLDEIDRDLLRVIVAAVTGRRIGTCVADEALDEVPRTTNFHGGGRRLTWPEITDRPGGVALWARARAMGWGE